jgi:hypothetical protein
VKPTRQQAIRLISRWIAGVVAGTLLVGVTSPLFVRSYLPRRLDTVRDVLTFPRGRSYRWRSEGYATTLFGALGTPGGIPPAPDHRRSLRVALWGDSQAEGVCVSDHEKIPAQVMDLSGGKLQVIPLARSGDDCNDWISQLERVEANRDLDAHVFLVVEWTDWLLQPEQPQETPSAIANTLATTFPAFMIQAARNIVTSGNDLRPRTLRFRPGPVASHGASRGIPPEEIKQTPRAERLDIQLARVFSSTKLPCVFLYAPKLPAIVDGQIKTDDPDEPLFKQLESFTTGRKSLVVDVRSALAASAANDRWPRGFHNGQFGVGHYNAAGNHILASAVIRAIESLKIKP